MAPLDELTVRQRWKKCTSTKRRLFLLRGPSLRPVLPRERGEKEGALERVGALLAGLLECGQSLEAACSTIVSLAAITIHNHDLS